jgi:S-adenosylmethionine hydrolase
VVGDQHGDAAGMIVLCTDFGLEGPYTGQVKAVLARAAPAVPVIDLFADLPPFRPQAAAYLLAAYSESFMPGDVIVTVVDPGVGGARAALALEADGRWYIGPDNGVFELVLRRAQEAARCWRIDGRPAALSATFHGRDLFAPVAARLALGQAPPGEEAAPTRYPDWPNDLPEIAYVDRYGNAMTGMRAAMLPADTELEVGGARIPRARTFSDVPQGTLLWYANANGLAEIAANGASAAATLELAPGAPVAVHRPG